MNRRHRASLPALTVPSLPGPWQALTLWTRLAMSTGEMLAASAQVIGHRTRRMHSAGPVPNARDRREFTRMGTEKVEAAQASLTAMTQNMAAVPMELWLRAWRDGMAIAQATSALGSSRSAAQAIAQQAQWMSAASRAATSMAKVGEVGARVAQHGLKPIHAKATANARRLGRR